MSDHITALEYEQEERKLTHIVQVMDKQMDSLRGTIGDQQQEIVEMKRHFWDEVSVDKEQLFETYVSIMQQAKDLANYERVQDHARRLLTKLDKHIGSPYFGRIDFREEYEVDKLPVTIGLMSVTDENGEHLVYDWRTPIASLFYDYAPGPVQYRTPMGVITGEMTLKRQYLIRNSKLEAVFDTGIQIGDDMLQDMLKRSADTKMKTIVSTIQREQNAIIRDDAHEVLIVQGAAGSGKTSAAMQRIAYLLYKYRESMHSEQVVLFSPNDLFNDYVSNILPELGESNMTQTTFQQYVDYRLRTTRQIEDVYDQAERLMNPTNEAVGQLERASARWKASESFMAVADTFVTSLMEEGIAFESLGTPKRTIITEEMLREHFYVTLADWSLPARMDKTREWIKSYLKEWAAKEVKRVYQRFLKQPNYIGSEEEMMQMSKKHVSKWVREMRRKAHTYSFIKWDAIYEQFNAHLPRWCEIALTSAASASAHNGSEQTNGSEERVAVSGLAGYAAAQVDPDAMPDASMVASMGEHTLARMNDGIIPYEDASVFLYIMESIEGFNTFNHIRQVVIDEAQDYSAFQYALLSRLFPRSKFTILGDWNQAIYESNRVGRVEMVQRMFPERKSTVIRLNKSYRSTKPISEFAHAILPDGEPAEPFNREGKPPVVHVVTEETRPQLVFERLQRLQEDGCQSIAILAKNEASSAQVYQLLSQKIDGLRRVTKHTQQFSVGSWVIPSYLAKGLEFDGVIIWDADQEHYGHERDRKLLYTVCTRALHELHLYAVGQPSPLLPAADVK
ncbi:RNA polymerase recycling motor HelD [Paenibacillus assamensis]|uniref:RNA polymerase recycling motor HelD n=1 Tax=Paenibacillus assamensis TaxID=311244 RepID=UPI000422299C|nr:RNA polymerase recycling motor HelD [Paenibacillus assamensis]